MEEQYDNVLLGILSNEGKIDKFLNVIFSFLYRRTDFYRILNSPQDKMGFPPGVSEKLVLTVFNYYARMAGHSSKQKPKQKEEKAPVVLGESAASEVEVSTTTVESSKGDKKKNPSRLDEVSGTTARKVQAVSDVTAQSQASTSNCAISENPQSESKTDNTKDTSADSERVYAANPECYNGAIRDGYSWSQWISEADVRVDVGDHISRGKQVRVDITRNHISVQAAAADGSGFETVLDKQLSWDVRRDECMWTLIPKQHVHIHLEKVQERWWENLFVGEESINVRKIDCSRPMTDLDDEAQAKVAQMMYDEQQKRLGKPTSEQQKISSMLKGAWNAEGSPFAGTDFDPSKINISGDGNINVNP